MRTTVLLLFLIPAMAFAQLEFQKTYGTGQSDQGCGATATADGGYIISGNSYGNLLGAGQVDNVLIKTDAQGVIEWVSAADSNASNQTNVVVENLTDNSFVVGAYTARNSIVTTGRGNVWFYNIDQNGVLKWSNVYGGDNNATSSYDEIDDIIRTTDGNFFAIGFSDANSFTTGNGAYDAILYKIDPSGSMLWAKALGTTDYEWGQAIIATTDGNYLVAGMHYDLSTFNIYLMKIDGSGNVIWANSYGGSGTSTLGTQHANYGNTRPSHSALTETSDGGYAITGYTDGYGSGGDDLLVLKVNGSGTLQWAKTYGTSGREQGAGIVELSGGDLLVGGHALGSMSGSNNDVILMRINSTGVHQWTRSYESGAGGGPNEYAGSIEDLGDGSVLLTGTINNASTNGNDIFLMKVRDDGTTNCTGSDAMSPTARTPTVVDVTGSIVVSAGGSSVAVTPVLVGSGLHGLVALTQTDLCLHLPLPIELISFKGGNMGSYNVLDWVTATETNNDHFTIERSTDGFNWQVIGQVDGAGNSNSPISYELIDDAPFAGVNYYRLKQTDFDGAYEYFDPIAIHVELEDAGMLIYPNPSPGNVTLSNAIGNVTILDVSGKVVVRDIITDQNQEIKLDHLDAGVYTVRSENNGRIQFEQLILN